jgi:hypothetical protein
MRRMSRARLAHLDARLRPGDPPVGRLLFLIPDLWPEADQVRFHTSRGQDELGELIVRRTGLCPSFGRHRIWCITVPVPDELLAMSEAEKEAFLEQHESRPRQPNAWEL